MIVKKRKKRKYGRKMRMKRLFQDVLSVNMNEKSNMDYNRLPRICQKQ